MLDLILHYGRYIIDILKYSESETFGHPVLMQDQDTFLGFWTTTIRCNSSLYRIISGLGAINVSF